MMRVNPFDGKGIYTKFVWDAYRRLMSREWFTHADVMADRLGLDSADELKWSISKCPNNGELRKAFRDICGLLKEKAGKDCIETRGNNRAKEFRYVGMNDNPLGDLQNASAIKDIRTYAQFCEDSAGFFPRSWLDYFFEDTLDLLQITRRRKNGEQMISSSIDRVLDNIHLLPILYEAIRDKRVLKIQYKPYKEESVSLVFHPHLLKEHNGRWFLFGHAVGRLPEHGYNLALDRIEAEPEIMPVSEKHLQAPKGFYSSYFENIVGVSHKGYQAESIILRATNLSIFRLTETKKIHHSQKTTKAFGQYEDGEYGEFSLYVEPNNEFIGRIFHMSDGLVVVSPENIRDMFRQRISKMFELYKE